ncbi:MAG: hypothetical protein JRE36_08215 [Deltaproteobacteria bacterium]|nr:hypothetical protein [Deltaproteobacteria bacterium]
MAGEVREFRVLFPQRHIPIILISILQAGKTLRKKSPNEIENRLTRRFCIKLNQIQIFRDGPLSIHPQQEILSSDPDKDTPEGYIDILVSCEFGSEVYFAIEAKRLRVRSTSGKMDAGNDDYVNDGMMRFVSGQYAPFMKTGAMLGYVYDKDINKARSGVAGYIKSRVKELKLISPKQLTKASIVPDKPIYETRHGLKKRTFFIYHIFLSV